MAVAAARPTTIGIEVIMRQITADFDFGGEKGIDINERELELCKCIYATAAPPCPGGERLEVRLPALKPVAVRQMGEMVKM